MIKEFFVALISFTLMAFAVVGLMFLVDQYAFPPLAETTPAPPPAGEDREKPSPPAEERRPPSPEPKAMTEPAPAAAPPAAAPPPSEAEAEVAVQRPAIDVAETAPVAEPEPETSAEPEPAQRIETAAVSPPEAPGHGADVPATGPDQEAGAEVSTAPLSPRDDAGRIESLSIGEQVPLSDGRIAYRVAPGDTFSQIVKEVIGTGRPSVWQDRAARMAIDHRRIAPGMVLIFDPPTESERASEG